MEKIVKKKKIKEHSFKIEHYTFLEILMSFLTKFKMVSIIKTLRTRTSDDMRSVYKDDSWKKWVKEIQGIWRKENMAGIFLYLKIRQSRTFILYVSVFPLLEWPKRKQSSLMFLLNFCAWDVLHEQFSMFPLLRIISPWIFARNIYNMCSQVSHLTSQFRNRYLMVISVFRGHQISWD